MKNIKNFIKENSEFGYAEFSKKFITTKYEIAGVRIPAMKKYAKEIEPEYIDLEDKNLKHEEIMLYGFSASHCKTEEEQLEYLHNLLPYIDNWATCDCIVCSLKKLKNEKSYTFFCSLLKDNREFYVRVGIIGLMRYFLKTDKQEDLLNRIQKITIDDYYVKMATSWLYAELCSVDYQKAKNIIANLEDKFIRNTSISKACQSFRVDKPNKEELKKLRIK